MKYLMWLGLFAASLLIGGSGGINHPFPEFTQNVDGRVEMVKPLDCRSELISQSPRRSFANVEIVVACYDSVWVEYQWRDQCRTVATVMRTLRRDYNRPRIDDRVVCNVDIDNGNLLSSHQPNQFERHR